MIPFHLVYRWLFKSFRIEGETELLDRLIQEGYTKFMIIKRSWIFALFISWLPLVILLLSILSIVIAYTSITIPQIQYTIILGNILLSCILIFSTFLYIKYFRDVYGIPRVTTDFKGLHQKLHLGDVYFTRFFNWTITNQFILFFTIIAEIVLMVVYRKILGDHIWILSTDLFVMFLEIVFLRVFRKKMIDLEMDFNMIVPGKVYFANQTGVLSSIQSIESGKIKTVRSMFPSKIASFFNYGTIDILTEGDTQDMLGTMTMYYVTDPDTVVSNIQSLLKEGRDHHGVGTVVESQTIINEVVSGITPEEHALDTREKIRDVLR